MVDPTPLQQQRRRRAAQRLSFDPKVQPWVPAHNNHGSIPSDALNPDFVRAVLGRPIDQPWELPDEFARHQIALKLKAVEAAVLVPVVLRDSGLTVLLTQRTEHLTDHAGQVSFPGGRVEHSDPNPIATALRETHEETGVAAEHIDVLGSLPRYLTGTGYAITPVTGLVRPSFELAPDEFEVAQVFEVPLAYLTDPANYRLHRAQLPDGSVRQYYSVPFEDYFIWGATAAMLRGVYQVLAQAFSSSNRR
jgi:8-oxo-dGTP pyrophosphatase MutT (NUDIX family)